MRLPKKGFLYPFQPELQTLSLDICLMNTKGWAIVDAEHKWPGWPNA